MSDGASDTDRKQGNADHLIRFQSIIVCPLCHNNLTWNSDSLRCDACMSIFLRKVGRPDFAAATLIESEDATFQQERMHHRSLRGRLYDIGQRIITSEYAPHDHRAAFLKEIPAKAVIIEFGSGNRRLRSDILNIDLFLFPNVDIAADIERNPIKDSTVDYAILDSVVEHVPNPQAVINEIWRVLKPGGKLFCVNPFLFPYHGYPAHYCNFTRDGMRHLLRKFSDVTVEPHYGPSSALANIASEYVAVSISGGRRTTYLMIRALLLLGIGWIRFLDRWLIRSEHSHRLAGMLCSIATK